MWSINGRFKGARYMVFGEADTVNVPEWLTAALKQAVADSAGVLELSPTGPYIKVDDPASMDLDDVVRVLESMTTIEDVHGVLPPRQAHLVFDDTALVY
ncbi:MAG: hypothetical protein ACOH10_07750 [Rhodoglobus sp.]